MKRILFTYTAALCSAVGLSSLKANSKTFATHYFIVNPGSGANHRFINADVSVGSLTAPQHVCGGAPNFKCVITFTDSQIVKTTLGSTILKTSLVLSQANVSTYAKRPTQ